MKRKFLFVLCVSLLTVSCDPTNTGNTPVNVEPPVIKNRLTSVTASEVDSGSPVRIFEAVYKDGHITELMTSRWFVGGIPDNVETMSQASGSKISRLAAAFGKPAISTKAVDMEWMFMTKVKYEVGRIILTEEDDGYVTEIILSLDNSGRVVSVTFKDDEEELDAMRISYNPDGQLSEYVTYDYYSSEEGDYIEAEKTTLEYTAGSISSAIRTLSENETVIDRYSISFTNIDVENKQGIFLPVLDNSGWIPAFSTLDIIGMKSLHLPKNGTVKVTVLDGEPIPDMEGFSVTMGFEYDMSSDGYIETLKSVTNLDLSYPDPEEGLIEEHEETFVDFSYQFEK